MENVSFQVGTRKIRPTSWVFFSYRPMAGAAHWSLLARRGTARFSWTQLCDQSLLAQQGMAIIAFTARHGQNENSGAGARSQAEAWPDWVERLTIMCSVIACTVLTGGNRVNPLPAEAKLSGENYCEAYELKLTSGKFSQGPTLSWALLFFTIPTLLLVPWRKI